MKFFRYFIILFIFISIQNAAFAQEKRVTAKPKSGESGLEMLLRHGLKLSKENVEYFNEHNKGKFGKHNGLFRHSTYILPIAIFDYSGRNIRESLNMDEYDKAKSIADYNFKLESAGIKKSKKVIWVPIYDINVDLSESKENGNDDKSLSSSSKKENFEINDAFDYSLFGEAYKNVKKSDNLLKNRVFYLVAGHGGPDPGAIGSKDGYELHEHEYAYDVTLRLARKLLEHGASVYMIVQDPNDGIRDIKYLNNGGKEILWNNDTISHIQTTRLHQRTSIINELYRKNRKKAKSQLLVEFHVDSRVTDKRIDIFFYHRPGCKDSRLICNTLLNTVKQKYEEAQPGRGYSGTVTSRNLYMLRNIKAEGVYIELGNIQNPLDQIRLIEANNRQAIANWISLGLIKNTLK